MLGSPTLQEPIQRHDPRTNLRPNRGGSPPDRRRSVADARRSLAETATQKGVLEEAETGWASVRWTTCIG